MCGIAGYWSLNNTKTDSHLINTMAQAIEHRGPDDIGVFLDDGLALGHTRLSIHDLSSSGHQPMFTSSQRWVIVFNGEIYNYRELREELLTETNYQFHSESDTEVLLNAIEYWGVATTLNKSVGMFAFAAFDRDSKQLYLARDRFGEKPLYYGIQNNVFGFASEIKSLKLLKQLGWQFEINRQALATYMRFGYVPTPCCIFQHIGKLEPGSYMVINSSGQEKLEYYWRAIDVINKQQFLGTFSEATSVLEEKLKQALELQMQADVPLGAFLSGGIDSSTIVALMQSMSSQKINTFSIGFNEAEFNEAEYARAVAKHLGTNHTDLYLTEQQSLDVIPSLPCLYDEPFADSSQIPTYLVSKIAKSKVAVSLSGDAGDELFGGYNRYFLANTVKDKILANAAIYWAVINIPRFGLNWLSKLPLKQAHLFDKLMKLQNIVRNGKNSPEDLYKQICSQNYQSNLVLQAQEYSIFDGTQRTEGVGSLTFQEWMMFVDSQTYMMDDILTKVDRAAMAVSLETRVPFLDHRVYEFAWQLPLEYKIKNGIGKRVLRSVLHRYVPKELIERPKMGFGIPLAKWLRNDLKDWAASLLAPQKIEQQGYLNSRVVSQYWQQHQSGKRNWQAALWTILMFQAWHEENSLSA